MAMTIVESEGSVTGGVDTHLDIHVAAVLDHRGALLGVEEFATTGPGCEALLCWLSGFGKVARIGIEGTGSYGAGLARAAATAKMAVVEVDRPNRQERHRKGKSDPIDAIAAARAAQGGQAGGLAKSRDGAVEAMRALLVAKRSLRAGRIKTMNQIRHLAFTAPEPIRARFSGLTRVQLVHAAAGLRPRPGGDQVSFATKFALKELGGRIANYDAERARLDAQLRPLVERSAPELVAMYGVGFDTAALLLVAAGDNPSRIASEAAFAHLCGVAPLEASSGKVTRHRLNRGGDRQANHALYRIVITRLSSDPRKIGRASCRERV
jgi:transposase